MKTDHRKRLPAFVIIFLCAKFGLLGDEGAPKASGTLTLEVGGLRNDAGLLRIAVYNSKETFLNAAQAFRLMSVPVKNGKASAPLENIPFGNYGIAVFHDENLNEKMDTNFLGIPKEGFGFSNTRRPLGPPSFDTAKFVFDGTIDTFAIAITYY